MAEGGSDPQGPVFRPEAGRAPVQTGDSNHKRIAGEGQKSWLHRGRKVLPHSRHHPYQRSHADRHEDQTGTEGLETYHCTGGSQMTSGKSTPEYCAVSKHISVIVHSLALTVDPGTFAQKLHEAGLVGSDITERASVIMGLTPAERIRPVIMAISAQTELQASALHQFIGVLGSFNAVLADVIRRAIDIERQQLFKVKSASTVTQADPITCTENIVAGTRNQNSMWLQADNDSALSGATPPQMATSGGSYTTSGKNTLEYCTISQHVYEVVHSLATTVDPGKFAQKLHEAGLVGSDIVEQATVVSRLTPTERIRPFIQAILAQTELQASVFYQFISVLRSFNLLLADALNKAIGTTGQSPGCLQAGSDSVSNGATLPQMPTSGDIHHLHSPPGSSSPGIATVSASTDQEMLDTGTLQLSESAPRVQSQDATAVTSSEAQIEADNGGSQVTSGRNTPEYCTMSKHISDVVYSLTITVDPGTFAQKLHEAGLIGSDIAERANVVIGLTQTERIRPVIMAILAQTELRASVFYQFISVLRCFNPLLADALNKALAAGDLCQPLSSFGLLYQETSILNPSVRDAGDRHLSQSSTLTVPAQSQPGHARTDTSPAQRRAITGAVDHQELAVTESNLLAIQKKFHHLKIHVRKKLENKQTDPEEIYDFIIDLYSCRVTDPNAFVIQVLGPASEATLRTIFLALTKHCLWDFMNYHLLGGVISVFASGDNDLKIELKDYEKDLTGYELVTKIPIHLDAMKYNPTLSPEAEPNPELFAKLSIKVNQKISEHSVVYVIDLWESLAHHCRLPLPILLLREVAEGCISITWKIPAILAPHVASKARKLEDYYDNNHIQSVILDGSTIYSAPQAELTPMTAEAQKDGKEDFPSPAGEHGGPAESAEIIKEPDMLPELLRERSQTKVLYRNFNTLYLHMDSPSVLPKLLHNEIIDAEKAEKLHFYTHRCAQNIKLLHALRNISFTSEVVLKLCEALKTTAGQETLGKKLLADFTNVLVTPPLQRPHYIPNAQPSDLQEVTDEFVLTLHHVVSAFDQMPGALQSLKKILGSLVLPLENGDVMPLVEPQAYEHSHTVQELFRCLSRYYNPVSIGLLQALTELSGCIEAEQRLSEYATTLDRKNHLLCVRLLAAGDKRNAPSANQVISMGHKLAHQASLEKLQSLHPVVFSHFQSGPKLATRITAEIDKQAISMSDYSDIIVTVCAMFQLPPLALVYIGCSTEPLVLAWFASKDFLSYVKGNVSCSPTVGRMLAEQKVTGIAFGDEQFKCPSLMEVEYFEACTYGLVEKIPSLLQAGVSVNVTVVSDNGLLQAVRRGKSEVVKFLLSAGAYPDQHYVDGMSPLLLAAQEGHEDIARVLLDAKADPKLPIKTQGDSPLIKASAAGHEGIVQLLIDAGADVNYHRETQGSSPLIMASAAGHEGIVQLLIVAGADVDYQREDGMSSLMCAAQNGYVGILQLLLKAGANPNLQDKDGGNPLTMASFKGHQRVVELLLENGADVNHHIKGGITALMAAACCGHHRVVELLLENGADLNHQTIHGQTALTLATATGHQRVVELLRNRADLNPQRRPDISEMMGQLALQMSMQGIPEQQQHHGMATETTGSSQSAELDISVMTEEEQLALALQMSMQGIPEQQHHVATETAGRSQSAELQDGMSLVTAAQRGQDNIVQKLLQEGANPNFQDQDGNTALILASGKGHLRVVQILLENGADLNLKTKGGMTAFDIASLKGHAELCQVLLQCS